MPRPSKSKIERYFNGETKKKVYPIDDIIIYELMSGSESNKSNEKCRMINIREEAVNKNVISILHAKLE